MTDYRERQRRTAAYAQLWRREAEAAKREVLAAAEGKRAAEAWAAEIADYKEAGLVALRERVRVLEAALALAEAALAPSEEPPA